MLKMESKSTISENWFDDFFESELWAQVHVKTKTQEHPRYEEMCSELKKIFEQFSDLKGQFVLILNEKAACF